MRGAAISLWCASWLAVATAAHPTSVASGDGAAARRWIRMLELPARRAEAARELLGLGEAAVPELALALSDPRPEVVCRAVLALGILGARAKGAVPALEKLAQSDDAQLAFAGKWGLARYRPQGITLIADYKEKALIEFDSAGKEIHRIGDLPGIWGATRLPSGNYLVSQCSKHVVEVDREGKVVWECKAAKTPVAAYRLPSDHTLIVGASPGRVIEVDRAGDVIWEFAAKHPSSVDRLSNGNTLIGDYGGDVVREVDRTGKVVWEKSGLGGPMDVDRLPDGGTLIAQYTSNGILKLDATGKTMLRIDTGASVECVARLPNGHFIAGGSGWLNRYDATGKKLSSWTNVGRVTNLQHY